MPKKLPIDRQAKRQMRLLYAQGEGPAEIAITMKRKGITLSSKSISNLAQREGWARDKPAVKAAEMQGVREALEQARKDGAAEFAKVLQLLNRGMVNDAQRLVDGWELVATAADASSLMRAKTLLAQRTFRFYGVDQPDENRPIALLAAVVTRPVAATEMPVSHVDIRADACSEADPTSIATDSDDLDFENED